MFCKLKTNAALSPRLLEKPSLQSTQIYTFDDKIYGAHLEQGA